MSRFRRLSALLLCATMLFSLFGCSQAPAETTPPTTETPTEAPTEAPESNLYPQAAQTLRNAQNLELELTTTKEITVGTETFTLVSDQELTLSGIGTDGFAAAMNEELEINGLYDEFTEYYADGVLYVNVYDEAWYQGAQSSEEFMARFAPAVLLDETLYAEISEEKTDNGTVLTFSAPTAAETWALPAGAEFISAGGTAVIDNSGALTKSTYTIEYTQGSTHISMEVEAKAEIPVTVELTAPENSSAYLEISCIDAPRLYDTAVIYLYSTGTLSSTLTQTVLSQAAGYTCAEQTQLHFTGTGDNHAAEITYTFNDADSTSATSTYTQTEHFENGIYSFSADGSEPEESTDVSADDMLDYAQSLLGGFLPALEYIATAESEDAGGLIYLDFGLTDAYGEAMNAYICSTLFDDEAFLDNYASAYATTTAEFYLVIDPATGFPLSSGVQYGGVHTIDGQDYPLTLQNDESYQIADEATYETITGESLPEEEPETQATPLLYRVTGPDGQEMYLMGTIHVGDARTAYLPDEVYAALEASDALAVEFDTIAFEESLSDDIALTTAIAMAYVNADGSTTKEYLEEDIYTEALMLMKASGSYSANAEYMKPYFWSQAIDNFYLTFSSLSAEKGMDTRLLKLAKEQGMEILEVESGMSQLQMLTGFSTELQVLLLEETLALTTAEYCADVEALYEQWCTGDEAALRELLAEEATDLTEEETALYEEYIDAMIIDRNAAMLDVATGYLESGDTVFVAVGLAHLLQENGLVDTLQEAGYTVEQVIYS